MTVHSLWLPVTATAHLRGRSIRIDGDDPLLKTVRDEARAAGMHVADDADVVIGTGAPLPPESFVVSVSDGRVVAECSDAAAALYAWFQIVREGAGVFDRPGRRSFSPAHAMRMIDHWDNVAVHPVMGQVERGYAGASLFFDDGLLREDLSRVDRYARALASIGINRIAINNVNVHEREAHLLTDDLPGVARFADVFRRWGIRLHLAVSFAAPLTLGDLDTADPLDGRVQQWWHEQTARVYARIPDFGGYLVKADSEGQPGPFAYGRDHADGANLLARALAGFGGIVHWRAFVYDHRQDWRDRTTDRARAAYDHFAPLDGRFDDNVVVQIKYGPMDFQAREPVSPVLFAMPHTHLALELQITQEYTGQQRHAVYLGPQWAQILSFRPHGDAGPILAEQLGGGMAAVSNVGDDPFWTGHPLAQANLYAYGRLAWDPELDPTAILDEWIAATFGPDDAVHRGIHAILDDSWAHYEAYTAPLGVGFMVTPGTHDGPSVDGYEYSPWGTYHFADRDGVGVDRTAASGTGFAAQYPEPWRSVYERLETVPDELLLFFHHVPYTHRLHPGKTVIQHIYDSHFDGVEAVHRAQRTWEQLAERLDPALFERGRERFATQVRQAIEWRDQVTTYFYRASGIADAQERTYR